MGNITIRRWDDRLKERLRIRADHHGRSTEDESREILTVALADDSPDPHDLAESIRSRFAPLETVHFPEPVRDPIPEAPPFDE